MRFRTPFAAAIAGMLFAAIPGTGSLAQQVTLKLHHFVPAQANQQKFWFEPWAKKLEQESGGKLKVEIYPSMQLGGGSRSCYDQAKDGVVDIVWTVAGTTPGRFPRLEVFELPFLSHAIGEKTAPAVWEFYEAYAKDELKDVKPLAVWGFGKGVLVHQGRGDQDAGGCQGAQAARIEPADQRRFRADRRPTAKHPAAGCARGAGQGGRRWRGVSLRRRHPLQAR